MAFNTDINSIINALIDLSEKFFKYDEERKQALQDMRGAALENRLAVLTNELRGAAKNDIIAMKAAVDRMITEVKLGNNYDASDETIHNAAALLKNSGMDFDAVEAIIEEFAGNITALKILKAAAAEEYREYFNKWIFDNTGALQNIYSTIDQLTYESGENYPSIISTIREQLVDFATRQGCGLDTPYKADALEQMRLRNICGLMGIDYDKALNNK